MTRGTSSTSFYSGEVIYIGPDDPLSGLIHAKEYSITATKMKSGRIRVDIDEALINHMTFDSKEEFDLIFRKRVNQKKRRKAAK